MTTGIELIAEERQRQIEVEGWTPEHDDQHDCGELASAAEAYIQASDPYVGFWQGDPAVPVPWPASWDYSWFKADPKNPIRSLVKAGALIAAEIDRLQREEASA